MQLNSTKALYAYWCAIRGDRTIPTRAALKPGPISALLPDLFILDWDSAERDAHFRLAGTRICTMLGAELAGQSFLPLWREDQQASLARLMHDMARTGTPLALDLGGERSGHKPVAFEMLLLPLLDDDGQPCRILGSLIPHHSSAWQILEPIEEFDTGRVAWLGDEPETESGMRPAAEDGAWMALWRRLAPFQRRVPLQAAGDLPLQSTFHEPHS